MAHLIDKDKVVAEIKKRYENWREKEFNSHNIESEIRMSECQHLMLLFNTIKTKEVDLDYIKKELDELIRIHKPNGDFGWGTLYNVATHFFELGLKTQKGEEYDRD